MGALTLSLVLAAVLGAAAHRGGLCTVKAVAEVLTSRRGWVLWSFLKAMLWTLTILGIAAALGASPGLRHWPLTGVALLGGVVFGLGAGVNGSCSFSTLSRLADGHLVMLCTLAGWPLGMAVVHWAWPGLHHHPAMSSETSPWVVVLLLPWVSWEALAILDRLATPGFGLLSGLHWPLSVSVALVALANGGILLLAGGWSFTSTMICAAGAAPLGGCARPASLGLISAAALVGMIGSALARGTFRLRSSRLRSGLRHGLAGVAMGAGSALIPGGNDGLILFGMPALSPHALPVWLGICLGIAAALLAQRRMGRPIMAIHCEGDICRSAP